MVALKSLTFDDLQLFARVAALGTLSALARERNVPVSQVSRSLARIEKTCGARLIHRSTHGLALTAEGEIFLAHCQGITSSFEELEGELSSKAGEACGLVRVAVSTVLAQHLLPSLSTLSQRHPRLRVDLQVSDQLADMARDGIDIAIRTSMALPDNLVARPLGHLGRALYATPAYLAQAGTPAHPDDLRRHRLITSSAAPFLNRWPFLVDGRPLELPAEGDWRSNDTGLNAGMVLQGLGIGRLATIVGDPLVRQKRLLPVLPDFVDQQPSPIYAVTSGARQRLPKIRACIDHWVAWFGRARKG